MFTIQFTTYNFIMLSQDQTTTRELTTAKLQSPETTVICNCSEVEIFCLYKWNYYEISLN
jgi:hypothetical protein